MLEAVLFDWDGVVVNTAEAHEKSWLKLAQELGRELPEGLFRETFGLRSRQIIKENLQWSNDESEIRRLDERKEALYRQTLEIEGVNSLPGTESFLQLLRKRGIRTAIGSSTARANIELALDLLRF